MIQPMGNPALSIRGVTHHFRESRALESVDLTVATGDIYGFLGLNGAGKTTTIRLIVGLLPLQTGEVEVLGETRRRAGPEVSRKIGVLFEDFAPHGYLTGHEQTTLQAQLAGLSRRNARLAATHWLARVGLGQRQHAAVRSYSMGMRKRLGLACALVARPSLLILDEPTNGLDPQGIADLRAQILEINAQEGVTFFLSSHILGEVEQLCRSVGILHRGRVALEGPVEKITRGSGPRCRLRALPDAGVIGVLTRRKVTAERDSGVPGVWRVELSPTEVPGLVRELVEAGVEIHEVATASETLESVFHRVVSDSSSPAPGGEASLASASA